MSGITNKPRSFSEQIQYNRANNLNWDGSAAAFDFDGTAAAAPQSDYAFGTLGPGTYQLGSTNAGAIPAAPTAMSEFDKARLNQQQTFGTVGAGISAFSSLANAWQAYEANKLAKKQFALQKEAYQTNLANQIKAYNTTLAGRRESTAGFRGETAAQTADYVKKHSL